MFPPPARLVFWPPACHDDSVINYCGRSGSCPRHPSARPRRHVVDDAEAHLGVSLCFFCKLWSTGGEDSTVSRKMVSGALAGGASRSIRS